MDNDSNQVFAKSLTQLSTDIPNSNCSDSLINCTSISPAILNATNASLSDFIFYVSTSVILGFIIFITIIGNVFVIAAIIIEKNLQQVANYLIVSLAVADLMVSCLVMPLAAVYEVNKGWIMGPELCEVWTSIDVLCCTASILHLVAIAIDRYWAVTNVDYIHTRRNVKRIGIMIFLIWLVAIVVSLAPQFGWKDPEYLDRIEIHQKCLVSQDVAYQIFATCSTFFVPLLIILIVYWKIFQTARKRIHRRRKQKQLMKETAFTTNNSTGQSHENLNNNNNINNNNNQIKESQNVEIDHLSLPQSQQQPQKYQPQQHDSQHDNQDSDDNTTNKCIAFFALFQCVKRSSSEQNSTENSDSNFRSSRMRKKSNCSAVASSVCGGRRDKKKESIEAKRERKAAKTLAIITGAFVMCWLPFFITAILMPLCSSCYLSDFVNSLFLWLGYFNSTLNPIIYTIFNPEFRQAFKRIFSITRRFAFFSNPQN